MRSYFVSGGTGFVGRAIVRELIKRKDTETIWLLTRHAQLRYEMLYWDKRIVLFEGDITTSEFPSREFTDIIHGANEANDLLQPEQDHYYYTIVEGTKRIIEWRKDTCPLANFMLLSSGVIYKGDTAYSRAKKMSEFLCKDHGTIARIYSLIGEEMPLNGQYAAGKFFAQALQGEVRYYDAGYVRSYLHVEDAARLIVYMMDAFLPKSFDVGSLDAVEVSTLARMIATVMKVPAVEMTTPKPHTTALVYLPREEKIPQSFTPNISLYESIRRVCDHLRNPKL